MFCIREVRLEDLSQVYKFTISLLQHHIGQCNHSMLDEDGFVELFQRGYVSGLILLHTPLTSTDNAAGCGPVEPIGCMIYHSDVSTIHGRGVYLDQFYIEPSYRRLGLGRLMMTKLCEKSFSSGGTYIKLTFQDGLGLEDVYGSMGFVNYSKSSPGLHFFEAYGKTKLNELINFSKGIEENTKSAPSETKAPSQPPLVLVFPLEPMGQFSCPTWMPLFSKTVEGIESSKSTISPPAPRLVIITEGTVDELPDAQSSVELTPLQQCILPMMAPRSNDAASPRMCLFVEQCSVCSWLGPMVNFSDFIGDTTLLKPELLYSRIQYWLDMAPNLRGASWEVPCGTDVDVGFDRGQLVHSLTQLNVPDDTKREGWNVAYLDAKGMRRLMDRPPSNKVQLQT